MKLLFVIVFCVNYVVSSNDDINSVITFTPPKGWVNDPNGCIYVNGIYHLMYQYNPNANKPGNISWGHSVSEDLVVWEDYGVAISQNVTRSEMIFSGNAVYDDKNTSNLCYGNDNETYLSAVVAFYTSAFQENYNFSDGRQVRKGAQVISTAYSCNENYENFTEYKLNPVIDKPPSPYEDQWQNFRDPNVMWYEPNKQWIMTVVLAKIRKVIWLASYNLIDWKFVGEFSWMYTPDGDLECPSLAKFNVENSNETKWVLLLSTNPGGIYGGSGMHYHIGNFNGSAFVRDDTNSSKVNWLDYGADCYAGILWNGIKEQYIMTFWLNNWRYSSDIGNTYKGALSSRKLQLRRVGNDYKLYQLPIDEIVKYKSRENNYTEDELVKGIRITKDQAYKFSFVIRNSTFELNLKTETGNLSAKIYYKNNTFGIIRHTPELNDDDNTTENHYLDNLYDLLNSYVIILLDNYKLEVFLNNGETLFTELIIGNFDYRMLYSNNISSINVIEMHK